MRPRLARAAAASADVADGRAGRRWLIAVAAVAGLCAAPGAGATEIGDFGRPEAGVVNDEILPALDFLWKVLTNRPHSTLDRTEAEQEMLRRVWRFLVAPYAKDWAFNYWDADTRLARVDGRKTTRVESYYKWISGDMNWLTGVRYPAPAVRYATMHEHMGADLAMLPKVFEAICRVDELDRQRRVALEGIDVEPEILKNVEGRLEENRVYVGQFADALTFRYANYDYALNHLLVTQPDPAARMVDADLNELAIHVDRARSGDFCSGFGGMAGDGDQPIRSRVLMGNPDEGEFRK